jgi:hypothetical protein
VDVENDAAVQFMKVHLFGLPISTHRRLKEESENWQHAVPEPHLFRATPIPTNKYAPFTEGEIRDLAASVAEGFTHIVIPASRDWRVLQSRFQFDCRVHIARLWQPLKTITWEVLKGRLHAATKLDEVWVAKFCPTDLRHPLLLPPSIFKPTRDTHRYWHRCDVYSEKQIPSAEELLGIVEKEHRKPDHNGIRSWLDGRKLRYRVDPSKHGLSAADRARCKAHRFCYEVPPGFHYDVVDDAGRTFMIEIDGKLQKVVHCNVTPWGHVRRG